jgi:ActR/RegA family two-component response regulator
MSSLLHTIIYSCEKATALIEKMQLQELSMQEKIRLRFHLLACNPCREYTTQSKFIDDVLKKHFVNSSDIENKNLENKILNTINVMNNKGTNNFDFYKSLLSDLEGDTLLQEVETEEVFNFPIAIVDDNQSFSLILSDYLLDECNLHSKKYTNGNDFLSEYKSGDDRIIILDYDFGKDNGPNGLVILKRIKEINPIARVIMVSGQDNLEVAIETMRQGAVDYFIKTNKTVFPTIVCSILKLIDIEKMRYN